MKHRVRFGLAQTEFETPGLSWSRILSHPGSVTQAVHRFTSAAFLLNDEDSCRSATIPEFSTDDEVINKRGKCVCHTSIHVQKKFSSTCTDIHPGPNKSVSLLGAFPGFIVSMLQRKARLVVQMNILPVMSSGLQRRSSSGKPRPLQDEVRANPKYS